MHPEKTALVLGATGGIGGEVSRRLSAAGWNVRALRRGLAQAETRRDHITWLRGDAMSAQDVAHAARGCSVIVHAVNPPGYRNWDRLVLPMIDNTIAAARAGAATIVLPGTLYNYGPHAPPLIDEDAAQQPLTRKGAIRVELERRLEAACRHGARALIVRAGDYFGPRPGNSWLSQAMLAPGKPLRTVRLPGQPGVGHQWAYLPDVAQTMVELLARRHTLDGFARFHMAGHWDEDGMRMARTLQRVLERRTGHVPRLVPFPWWLLGLAAPFVATLREMREMRYLWRQPVRMTNARLCEALGAEPWTAWDSAVDASLDGLLGAHAGALSGAR